MTIVIADAVGGLAMGRVCGSVGKYFGPQTALGATLTGGLIGAVAASFVANRSPNITRSGFDIISPLDIAAAFPPIMKKKIEISQYLPQDIQLRFPDKYNEVKKIGAEHNAMMNNLLENDLDTTTIKNYMTDEEYNFITSDFYKEKYDSTMTYIYNSVNEGNNISISGDNLTSRLMNLFFHIIEVYPVNANDMEFILNKYIEVIEESNEFSDNDKELIYSSLSIAASSYEFWTEKGVLRQE